MVGSGKEGIAMTKRRLYKMTPLQRDILAKVLVETQKEFPPEQAEKENARITAENSRKALVNTLYFFLFLFIQPYLQVFCFLIND